MPRISEFYGIFIYMYFQDVGQHHAPHVHVRYGEYKAVFAIETGERLAGRLADPAGARLDRRPPRRVGGELAARFARRNA